MTDTKKRLLIIDDDFIIQHDPKKIFGASSMADQIEVQVAPDIQSAIQHIAAWQTEGNFPDLITIDMNDFGPKHMRAGTVLPEIVKYLEDLGRPFDKINVMVQTKGHANGIIFRDTHWIEGFETLEFNHMEAIADLPAMGRSPQTYKPSVKLRDWCNRNWGTKFPLSVRAYQFQQSATDTPVAKEPSEKDKIRILFVDDDLEVYVEPEEFLNGTNLEGRFDVRIARFSEDAIEILDEWAAEGYRPNIISCDDNTEGQGEYAAEVLPMLLDHLKAKGLQFMPDDFFVQSKSRARMLEYNGKYSGRLNTEELTSIAFAVQAGEYFSPDHSFFSYTEFREYANEKWGADFILNQQDYKFKNNPDARFDIHTLHDMVKKGLLTPDNFLLRMDMNDESLQTSPTIIDSHKTEFVKFLDGVGGPIAGRLAFNEKTVWDLKQVYPNDPVVLFMNEYEPAQTRLFSLVQGVVLMGEGREHLKIILENLGVSGVMGFDTNNQEMMQGTVTASDGTLTHDFKDYMDQGAPKQTTIKEGDYITVEATSYSQYENGRFVQTGASGTLFFEKMEMSSLEDRPEHIAWQKDVLSWADQAREKTGLRVKANVDSPAQIKRALKLGADDIGLVRSEHLLLERTRLDLMQTIMTATDDKTRSKALRELQAHQQEDFAALIDAAHKTNPDATVTIRLLDAPLEEFLNADQVKDVTARVGADFTRGAQFAKKIPGLYEMQVQALFDAGYNMSTEILVPNVESASDMADIRAMVTRIANGRMFRLGAMIESLNAAQNVGAIAAQSDFLSIGSNDLMADIMGGIKRHDVEGINSWMIKHKVKGQSPFRALTPALVAQMKHIVDGARAVNPDIEISVCGQQMSNDNKSTKVALDIGLSAISVSPQFVETQRLFGGYYAQVRGLDKTAARKQDVESRLDRVGAYLQKRNARLAPRPS